MEQSVCKVLNTHHFGGVEKLPSTAKYIGRPSPFGNAYSSHTGQYTREECIALHLILLYQTLVTDRDYLSFLRNELGGYDLACWCVLANKVKGCHGENFLHVLSDKCKDRTYDRSVTFYLMDDLKTVFQDVKQWVTDIVSSDEFLFSFICVNEAHLDLEYTIRYCREKNVSSNVVEFFLAHAVVNLQLAKQDRNVAMIEYRLRHTSWLCARLLQGRTDRAMEPSPPDLPVKQKKKVKDIP